MAAVHSTPLPASLDPLSTSFSKLSTDPAPQATQGPASRIRATIAPIVDSEEIRKAVFETAYEPSEKFWADSQASYVKPEVDDLPEGFPEVVTGPTVWDGKKLINEPEKWLHTFTEEEIADVDQAIAHFISLDLPFKEITKETFPLTTLKPALDKAVDEIHTGLGLRVFRGLPVQKYDRKSQIIAFAGIGAYIGDTRFKQGSSAIVHLRDITKLAADDRPAIVVKGQTAGNQVFHTDSGDIIGLLTLDKAAVGGLSQLSSVGTFYNTLAASRRDVLRTLAAKKWQNRYNAEPHALIHHIENRVIAQYGRRPFFPFFEDQSVPDGIPAITKEQHLALDALHFTAEDHSLDIDLLPGDLEFFNNLVVFHARTASEDDEEHQRHLIRLWLRNEKHALQHGEALNKRWEGLNASGNEHWAYEAWEKVPREA